MEQSQDREQGKQSQKLNGSFADISSLCEALRKAIEQCNQDSVSIGVVSSDFGTTNGNLDGIDRPFSYTQILVEILLTINFGQEHVYRFTQYCRSQFERNAALQFIEKFEREYFHHGPIWWYTHDSFLHVMLNRSLRLMDFDVITNIAFFVRDLHNHIVALHAEQYYTESNLDPFIVYRGQHLSQIDFDHLKNTQGGFLSFTHFLSTSTDRNVALKFALHATFDSSSLRVLFLLKIDRSSCKAPFANIAGASRLQREEEILFSMHTVFRIGQIEQIRNNNCLWQVELILTDDHYPKVQILAELIRKESYPHKKGWYRLGSFLFKVGQFDKAEEVFETILDQACHECEEGNIYHMLAIIKFKEEDYIGSISFFEKSMEIMQKILSSTHPYLASFYRNISVVYDKIGDYPKALSCQHKAFSIYRNMDSLNHHTVSAFSDSRNLMNETSNIVAKPLSSFEMAIQTLEETLPKNDLALITYYDLCGFLYEKMGNDVKALIFYHQAYIIKRRHLPPNHPSSI